MKAKFPRNCIFCIALPSLKELSNILPMMDSNLFKKTLARHTTNVMIIKKQKEI